MPTAKQRAKIAFTVAVPLVIINMIGRATNEIDIELFTLINCVVCALSLYGYYQREWVANREAKVNLTL